jgi:uncharacterized protein (DUF488 family)
VLYTIGYQGFTQERFVSTLVGAGIDRVIDVRMNPVSRKKGFSLRALAAGLEHAGIAYEHWRELGNPPEIRKLYAEGHVAQGREQLRAFLNNGHSGAVDRLIEESCKDSIVLVCLEKLPELCHRSVVAGVAADRAERTLDVIHL